MKDKLFESMQHQLGVFDGAYDENAAHDQTFCKMIAAKVQESEFPADCRQFSDAVSILKRHNSTNDNPYVGLSPGEAIDAKRAKAEGHLNNAQITRRMTTKKNGRFY